MSRTTQEVIDAVKAKKDETMRDTVRLLEDAAFGAAKAKKTATATWDHKADAPVPLPADEQIATLLKENERLKKIEAAAKRLANELRGFRISPVVLAETMLIDQLTTD